MLNIRVKSSQMSKKKLGCSKVSQYKKKHKISLNLELAYTGYRKTIKCCLLDQPCVLSFSLSWIDFESMRSLLPFARSCKSCCSGNAGHCSSVKQICADFILKLFIKFNLSKNFQKMNIIKYKVNSS